MGDQEKDYSVGPAPSTDRLWQELGQTQGRLEYVERDIESVRVELRTGLAELKEGLITLQNRKNQVVEFLETHWFKVLLLVSVMAGGDVMRILEIAVTVAKAT
jgi:hypothetical protein